MAQKDKETKSDSRANLRRKKVIPLYLDEEEFNLISEWAEKSKKPKTLYIREVLFNDKRKKF